jgi:hypothetical protein
MTSEGENELLVPKSQYDEQVALTDEAQDRCQLLFEENKQLKEAIKKSDLFQKASDVIQKQTVKLTIETWQKAREIAMDLLHVKMGHDNVTVAIEYQEGKLIAIRPEA